MTSKQRYDDLVDKQSHFGSGGISMMDHAEMWWYEQGKDIPERDTEESQTMYESWVEFAFKDL